MLIISCFVLVKNWAFQPTLWLKNRSLLYVQIINDLVYLLIWKGNFYPVILTLSPASPECHNKTHFQPETLWPHHWWTYQPSLASRAGANYIQGGDADQSCTAWLCTTLLGVVIHMCCRHAAPMQAEVRLLWTSRRSDLSLVNGQRSCLSCCRIKGENCLPSNITSASSLSVFNKRLKTYLFHRCYETIWLWMTFPSLPIFLFFPLNSGPSLQ